MKAFLLTVSSIALSAGVIANSYVQKKQFYPSVVYITKSSPSMAILYLQAFVLVFLMGKLMRKVFFGQLRAAEMEHLIERSWYAVTETCLAFTVFRDDFSPRFVALFTLLLFLKCFHWLAEDRIDYMERSPIISWIFHVRAVALLLLLGVLDLCFINHAYYSTLIKGPSVQLVFGFEYAILLTIVVHIFVKYLLHSVDLRSENPWENKAVYLLYTELVLGFLKAVLYMMFLAIMTKVHTFPLFAIRPMYLTVRAFKKAVNDVLMSRRAIRNMNTLYPDATAEDLTQTDNVCIICREEMAQGCKKLPCNHIFHTSCLRSWFQRQQTCPTCRMNVLDPPPQQARQQPQQQPQQQHLPQQQGMFPGIFGWPPAAGVPAAQPANAQQQQPPSATSGTPAPATPTTPVTTTADNSNASNIGMMMPPFMPPMMMPMNFGMPFPSPSPDLAGLSDEEVHMMEGTERQAVEARIQCLRNIQTLLDAAVLQMQQYSSISSNLSSSRGNPFSWTAAAVSSAVVTPSTTLPVTAVTSVSTTVSNDVKEAVTTTTDTSSSQNESCNNLSNASEMEGAVGFSPEAEPVPESIPEWTNTREENDDAKEMRRRRLERFSSNTSDTSDKNQQSLPNSTEES